MNTLLPMLLENDALDAELEAFCTNDPEYLIARQQFYEAANEIAQRVGFNMYDTFERSFGAYLSRTADLYYLFGLGFRQELLKAIGEV